MPLTFLTCWKTMMNIFLTSYDFDLWQVVLYEYMDPKIKSGSWDNKS